MKLLLRRRLAWFLSSSAGDLRIPPMLSGFTFAAIVMMPICTALGIWTRQPVVVIWPILLATLLSNQDILAHRTAIDLSQQSMDAGRQEAISEIFDAWKDGVDPREWLMHEAYIGHVNPDAEEQVRDTYRGTRPDE